MPRDPIELLPPRILVVDDERQIHASLRLRLAPEHELVFCCSAQEALARVAKDRFDLCLADIHMPEMDGLKFIDAARKIDPQLGYVVLSAFDTDDNLRRTIPLQVYDFIAKPLPTREQFEARIAEWIETTRKRRREHQLLQQADVLATERNTARMERDVEFVASESTRDALQQTASLQTTADALCANACALLEARIKRDPSLGPILRCIHETRRATEAAMSITEAFFGSAYGNRDSSPALANEGVREAITIAARHHQAEQANKVIDFAPIDFRLPIRGLSGIAFLLMMLPAVEAALVAAPMSTTIAVRGNQYPRVDGVSKDPKFESCLWVNRRNALGSMPALVIQVTASAPALVRSDVEAWLRGQYRELAAVPTRGMAQGIEKCHGLLGIATAPEAGNFRLVLVLPI